MKHLSQLRMRVPGTLAALALLPLGIASAAPAPFMPGVNEITITKTSPSITSILASSALNNGGTIYVTSYEASEHVYAGFTVPAGFDVTIAKLIEPPTIPLTPPKPAIFSATVSVAGPGITVSGGSDVILEGLTVEGFSSPGGAGGGLDVTGSSHLTASDCIFQDNSSDSGAGAWLFQSDGLFTNCLFKDNDATTFAGGGFNSGGGLRLDECNGTIEACTFEGNTAGRLGGGLAITGSGFQSDAFDVYVRDSFFDSNTGGSSTTGGGGIGVQLVGTLHVSRSTFSNNEAARGGAIDLDVGRLIVDYSQFFLNNATEQGGGAISQIYSYGGVISNSLFEGNSTTGFNEFGGGAILSLDDAAYPVTTPNRIQDCLIVNNSTDAFGGGIFCGRGGIYCGDAVMDCGDWYGGDSYLDIERCTIDGNSAVYAGGGIANYNVFSDADYHMNVTNTILNDNTVGTGSPSVGDQQVWGTSEAASFARFDYCFWDLANSATRFACNPATCITGSATNPGYDASPSATAIANQPNTSFYLEHDSPVSICVDAGDPSLLLASSTGEPFVGTTEDDSAEAGTLDIGFHYGAPELPARITLLSSSDTVINGSGSIVFNIDAGPTAAGSNPQYIFFLASVTGTSPGVALGPAGTGPFLPLYQDALYNLRLQQCLGSIYSGPNPGNACGYFLDAGEDGLEEITLTLQESEVNTFISLGFPAIWHAALVWDFPTSGGAQLIAPSSAIKIDLIAAP